MGRDSVLWATASHSHASMDAARYQSWSGSNSSGRSADGWQAQSEQQSLAYQQQSMLDDAGVAGAHVLPSSSAPSIPTSMATPGTSPGVHFDGHMHGRHEQFVPAANNIPGNSVRSSTSTGISHAKRQQVPNACAACRKRKSKCDAVRPTCKACHLRKTTCEYLSEPGETSVGSLKRKYNQLVEHRSAVDEIYGVLSKCSDIDAQAIFRNIRCGVDPSIILRQSREANLRTQVNLVPQTTMRYDFPFLKEMPAQLLQPDNPYLHSLLYESTFHSNSYLDQAVKSPTISRLTKPQSPYLKPYHAAKLAEPLLDKIRPSEWTAVTEDNGLLRKLLEAYFLMEYQWLPVFHKDLFLEDMASGGTDFCSKMLVNALLARACQSLEEVHGRAEFWNPDSLYYRFLAEAKRFWELQAASGDVGLTTIQAAVLLDMSYRVNCLDKVGKSYLVQAVRLGESIQLFKASSPDMSQRMRVAREFTARTLYSYQTVQAYYYLKAPFMESELETPLPDPLEDKSWYGEVWITYPLDRFPIPTHFGILHQAKLTLHLILTDLARRLFSRAGHIAKLTVSEAQEYQAALESWYKSLHETLTPANIVYPTQLKLHIEYYKTVWLLWETFVDLDTADTPELAQDLQTRYLETSKIRFETLMRLYFLRHSFSSTDQYLVILLLTLACSALDGLESCSESKQQDSLISTALLCAKGLFDQSKVCYVAEVVLHVVRDKMTPRVRALLAPYLRSESDFDSRKGMASEITRSELPIPIVNMGTDSKLMKLENFVKAYSEMTLDMSSV